MIRQDAILTGLWTQLNSDTNLRSILGAAGRIVKGPKRPAKQANPCVTVHMPVSVLRADWFGTNKMLQTYTDPCLVNIFVDNYPNGAMNVALLDTICARISTISAQAKPAITGASVHRLGLLSEAGPLYDQQSPGEAMKVIAMGYWITPS